ncbi:hypothetical protein VOLCADRAFT_90888 [Volvox carteri f. nagariensis]|uniref:Uncharacterized protein n=1 Tax=Volvox carteri f. nagariensis TaxID=3068 RepID=D8TVB9_VOLCA|nr:uncharacterized protein VOLCADRAFT_90888 [Volvox carteri f. nagariensis]EFJ48551.1 hypothetical protein VOLCADRAFT_90888 [Volvox carteri f. nagariensis]|eukprot:XP_002950350.1 hypothetical protein VOLCADRAFT_90888 [Volvox carteri f. nagariensis]
MYDDAVQCNTSDGLDLVNLMLLHQLVKSGEEVVEERHDSVGRNLTTHAVQTHPTGNPPANSTVTSSCAHLAMYCCAPLKAPKPPHEGVRAYYCTCRTCLKLTYGTGAVRSGFSAPLDAENPRRPPPPPTPPPPPHEARTLVTLALRTLRAAVAAGAAAAAVLATRGGAAAVKAARLCDVITARMKLMTEAAEACTIVATVVHSMGCAGAVVIRRQATRRVLMNPLTASILARKNKVPDLFKSLSPYPEKFGVV